MRDGTRAPYSPPLRAPCESSAGLQLGAAATVVSIGATMVYAAEIVMRGFLNTGYPDYYEVVGIAFIYIFMFGAGALYARTRTSRSTRCMFWCRSECKKPGC